MMEASNFFSRLLKQPKSVAQAVEVDDIAEFDKAWRSIQETLEHPDERQLLKGIQSTDVPRLLTHIVDALVHESNQIDEETLGSCMEYFVNQDLLANLERLCEKDRPHGIKSEVLRALNNLIVLLPDKFLVHNSVHRPLRRLLKSCIGDETSEGDVHGSAKVLGAAGVDLGMGVEDDLVDLMCVLCSRMRAYPPLLLIFFHDKGWLQPNPSTDPPGPVKHSRTQSLSSKPSTTPNFEFLLFSYLLRFIHREGKTGDFARAGLLFLFDIAFLPSEDSVGRAGWDDSLLDARRALAGYILDGDFVDVMAAGLGAVWSLLPSKLRVPTLGEVAGQGDGEDGVSSGGMVLGADRDLEDGNDGIRLSTDEDVRTQIGMLVKLFGFLQDIMVPNNQFITSSEDYETESSNSGSDSEPTILQIWGALVNTSLDAIQSSFLENVLYPSILECSPHDGSSVAIITYLDILLSNIEDGVLLDRLMDFLLCRGMCKSENEDRFTMKDLILDNINSNAPGAVGAGLKLMETMMREHCDVATGSLLSTIGPGYTPADRQPIPNSNELELYASLVERLDHTQSSLEYSYSYATYLSDIHSSIQNDKCFQLYQLFQSSEKEAPPLGKHKVEDHNVMLRSLLSSLGMFLCRGADENVALTGVIVTMAQCPFRSLEGWLTFNTDTDPWASIDCGIDPALTRAKSKEQERPAIYQILTNLVTQISTFRSQIPNFDNLLAERRSGLLYTDNLDEAMKDVMIDIEPSNLFGPSIPMPIPTTPTPKKKGVMGTIASYLTPSRGLGSPSSNTSPAPTTPQGRHRVETTSTMSPYKAHYETLAGREVDAVPSPLRGAGSAIHLGGSTSYPNTVSSGDRRSNLETDNAERRTRHEEREGEAGRKMSLSTTLDNCIILEEFIKELVAVISARRGLGIDPVSFL